MKKLEGLFGLKLGEVFDETKFEDTKKEFKNQSINLVGNNTMRVDDLLKMLSEIMGYKSKVKFQKSKHPDHYIRTPYAYQSKLGRNYSPSMHIDLGQGLLQLIEEVKNKYF